MTKAKLKFSYLEVRDRLHGGPVQQWETTIGDAIYYITREIGGAFPNCFVYKNKEFLCQARNLTEAQKMVKEVSSHA